MFSVLGFKQRSITILAAKRPISLLGTSKVVNAGRRNAEASILSKPVTTTY